MKLNIFYLFFIFLVFSLFTCEDIKVSSKGKATAPAEARSVTANYTSTSTTLSWQAPILTSTHKKADEGRLTTADVSYKIYRAVKGKNARSIAEIKTADPNPITVGKEITSTTITNLTPNTTYEIVVQSVNTTDPTKTSIGIRIEVTTLATNQATAPPNARIVRGSPADTSTTLSWQAPNLTSTHKKADGGRLTTADVSYKIYRVAKGSKARSIDQIKTADTNPIAVAKGTTRTTIRNLAGSTTYEIVVQSVNATDPTKTSTGIRIEVTTLATNQATAPSNARSVTASHTNSSIEVSWQAPMLTSTHKKANGQRLTISDVSYKVYRVTKGSKARTIAQIKTADTNPIAVTKGTTSTTIDDLAGSTTYEIVVQSVNATDTTKISTGTRIEVTTNSQATAPSNARNVTASHTNSSIEVSWQAPMLTSTHKKANGQRLTISDVSYKVYRVTKGSKARTIAQIKTADTNPIAVAKGTTSTTIHNLAGSTTYEIVVQSVNATDPTKTSTGVRIEVTTNSQATAPSNARSVTASHTNSSIEVSWQAPMLTSTHKKANGQRLTISDVSYKVYRVTKGSKARTIDQIKTADTNPIAVTKGTTSTTIDDLAGSTTYEIVVQSVNATDTTKISTGTRIEVTTNSQATAPSNARNVTASHTNSSIEVSWQAPMLTSTHKKADGGRLTISDVSYKIYRVAKGKNARTIAQIKTADTNPIAVAKGTTRTTIRNLAGSTTYEIVVQSVNTTDPTKTSTGVRIEITTNSQATAPPNARSVTASHTNTSTTISWQAPMLTSTHKQANGQRLTSADVSYKIYRVAKGSKARSIDQIKTADTNPIAVAKGTTSTTIRNLAGSTTYEIVVQSVNTTDPTKTSTGVRIEITTPSHATVPEEVRFLGTSRSDDSISLSWVYIYSTPGKKANGQRLTAADVSYKVYRVAKGKNARTIDQIKTADKNPIVVAKGTTSTTIRNLTINTTYEIVVQSVNTTDTTKISTGTRIEVNTNSQATAPEDTDSVTVNKTDDSISISWQAPTLTSTHKKADGGKLTTADVSYKVYRVAKGNYPRSTDQIKTADTNPIAVAKGTTRTTIRNLNGNTIYEIVVQSVNATDTTKVSTGVRIEVTTK